MKQNFPNLYNNSSKTNKQKNTNKYKYYIISINTQIKFLKNSKI